MDKLINKVLKIAKKSQNKCDFPVAAIIFKDDKIISYGYNKRKCSNKVTDHAEIIAIEKANKKLHSWRLIGYNMLVTLEPCEMCKTVIKESRISNIYYLIKRYDYKKQYQKTNIQQLTTDNKNVENYKAAIMHFFDNKR